jgi:hypothetical protein
MDNFETRFPASRARSPGALFTGAVLGLIGFAIWWAAGRQTQRDLAACRTGYANARTSAESLLVDSMHAQGRIPRRATLFSPSTRCAAFRSHLAR